MTTFIEKGWCGLVVFAIDADSAHLSEPGDVSDEDDDIEVGGVTQDFKCPLTLTPLQDPLTSFVSFFTFRACPDFDRITNSRKVCKHSFSGAAIREYLSRGVKKCPAAGCNKKITLNDLKEDRALERKVKEHARRAAMRAEDEDVDAEIID